MPKHILIAEDEPILAEMMGNILLKYDVRVTIANNGQEALETLEKVDTLVFDKTGTLTEGKPRLSATVCVPPWTEPELLRCAATLERGSEHPLAAAIVAAAQTSAGLA